MAEPVIMPRQGQSVETCIITEWAKKPGDTVAQGDILFSYETDKASFEEEAQTAGVLLEIFFQEGDEVPVLTNVAVIGEKGEDFSAFLPQGENPQPPEKQAATQPELQTQTQKPEKETALSGESPEIRQGKIRISPRAQRLARQNGIEYKNLSGTGPEGRIIERDLQKALESQPRLTPLAQEKAHHEELQPKPQGSGIGGRITGNDLTSQNQIYGTDFEIKKLSNIRKIIAKSMLQSLQNSAQLTHHLSADVRKLLALRKKVKKQRENDPNTPNITLNDMVCFAVIRALKKHPQANSHFLGESIRTFHKVHLGFAVDTPRGLMVPVAKNADDLSLQGLSAQLKALAESCRAGSIDPELLASQQASFTVSNLGGYGVEMFTPVLNLPQVGILGVNTIINRPADLGDGVFGFVPYIGLSLTYDHRAIDGGPATLFLAEIKKEIENFDTQISF